MSSKVLVASELAIGYAQSRHPARVVAENINLELKAGELVCLLGPNGAGKSTLLRTLAGIIPPLSGKVWLGGEELSRLKPVEKARQLGVVLTDRIDVGMLTGYALVALGRYPHTGWSGRLVEHDEIVVRRAIEMVGAGPLARRTITELSDGERQKLMIARALAQEPQLLILDEPTAFLDLPRRVDIIRILRELAYKAGRAVLVSTHDLDLAMRSADRIWLLPPGGPPLEGAPEDLVLSGAFEKVFYGEGLRFNQESGAFLMVDNWCGEIELAGEGLAATWTARALERNGFRPLKSMKNPPCRVEAFSDNRWKVCHGATVSEFISLYELVETLKRTPLNL